MVAYSSISMFKRFRALRASASSHVGLQSKIFCSREFGCTSRFKCFPSRVVREEHKTWCTMPIQVWQGSDLNRLVAISMLPSNHLNHSSRTKYSSAWTCRRRFPYDSVNFSGTNGWLTLSKTFVITLADALHLRRINGSASSIVDNRQGRVGQPALCFVLMEYYVVRQEVVVVCIRILCEIDERPAIPSMIRTNAVCSWR